jgi:hypothetical protein
MLNQVQHDKEENRKMIRNTIRIAILAILFILLVKSSQATVFITHGLGTQSINYYQSSKYIDLIKESAKNLGHETVCIPWLDQDNPEKNYAGILPQERIYGAITIAKAILNEIKIGNPIILIGHGYGGQVMACATQLLNPENKTLTDSFIYELIYTIKNYGQDIYAPNFEPKESELEQPGLERSKLFQSGLEQSRLEQLKLVQKDLAQTRAISINTLLNSLTVGWQVSKKILNAIEESKLINQNLIKLVKQNVSLEFIKQVKDAWSQAFTEIQNYKAKLFKNGFVHKNSIQMFYTIGTAHNGDTIFLPDMNVVQHHVNFYSSVDSPVNVSGFRIPGLSVKFPPKDPRAANIGVLFEPTKSFAPNHDNFCGNVLMAPWILQIPNGLKSINLGGFDQFEWGKNGTVTFYSEMIPSFKSI